MYIFFMENVNKKMEAPFLVFLILQGEDRPAAARCGVREALRRRNVSVTGIPLLKTVLYL